MGDLERRVELLEKKMAGVNDIMTIDEASLYTGLAKSYLYKLTSKNEIPYYKPLGKIVYFEKAELDKWLRLNHISSVEEIEANAAKISLARI